MSAPSFSVASAVSQLSPSEQRAFRQRYDELCAAAAAAHFVLRDDSMLVWRACTNSLEPYWTDAIVVEELQIVHRLYTEVNYHTILEVGLRELANALKREYDISWSAVWKHVREYGVPALKAATLRTHRMMV